MIGNTPTAGLADSSASALVRRLADEEGRPLVEVDLSAMTAGLERLRTAPAVLDAALAFARDAGALVHVRNAALADELVDWRVAEGEALSRTLRMARRETGLRLVLSDPTPNLDAVSAACEVTHLHRPERIAA